MQSPAGALSSCNHLLIRITQFNADITIGHHLPVNRRVVTVLRDMRHHGDIVHPGVRRGVEHYAAMDPGIVKEIMEVRLLFLAVFIGNHHSRRDSLPVQFIVHTNGDTYTFPGNNIRRDIGFKWRIAALMLHHFLIIYPHFAVMSDRIETQHDTLARPTFRYKDFALIPDVAHIITNICIGELIVKTARHSNCPAFL